MKRYNGKVRFLESDINFKAGKVYEIKDGKICNDDGESFPVFEEFWTFEDVKRYFSSDEGTYSKNGLLVERYATKQKEKIYISGPISGTEDYKERFEKAEKELKALGYRVINPAKVNANLPEDTTWEEYMKISLCMLSMCDGIYMMEGWPLSRGARTEYHYALGAGKTLVN